VVEFNRPSFGAASAFKAEERELRLQVEALHDFLRSKAM
jgi:hypothetical protein